MQNNGPFVFATACLKRDLPKRFAAAPILKSPLMLASAVAGLWNWLTAIPAADLVSAPFEASKEEKPVL